MRARLELAAVGVEDVAGLQVAVQHPVIVQKRHARQQLLHQALHLRARRARQPPLAQPELPSLSPIMTSSQAVYKSSNLDN